MAKVTEDIFAKLAEYDVIRKKAVRMLLKESRKIGRQLEKLGHSMVPGKRRRSKRRLCKSCGKTGHNSRTCPQAKGKKS
jgi:hypothetical protein